MRIPQIVKPHSRTDFGVEIGTALEPVVVFYTKLSPGGLKRPTLLEQPGTGGVRGGVGMWRGGWGRGVERWAG